MITLCLSTDLCGCDPLADMVLLVADYPRQDCTPNKKRSNLVPFWELLFACVFASQRDGSKTTARSESVVGSLCLTLSQKQEERWGTLYNRVGVVKRHVDQRRFCFFSFVEGFVFAVAVASVFRSCHQGSLLESCGGTWFHQPSIRSYIVRP
jgi:hypothetical protein